MAVVSISEIEERLQKDAADPESLVITPLLDSKVLGPDSIDLRLGCYFLLPRLALAKHAHFTPDKKSSHALYIKLHVPLGRYIVLPAHQTVLGATLEFIKLPYDLSGQILTKSSVARTFTPIEAAPWIHPSYRGCLTLEIANVSNTPMLLYPGRAIDQLVLMKLDPPLPKPKRGQERLSGRYVGPVYPEAPEFDDPADELRRLGIKKIWYIPEPTDKPRS